jgi:hypothetical protein
MTALEKTIQRFVDLQPNVGVVRSGTRLMGEFDDRDPVSEYRLRKLTVAPIFPYREQITGEITLPGNILIGPIDVPFSFNVTSPAGVVISAPNLTQLQTIQLTLADLPDSPNLYGATHTVLDAQGAVLFAVPDACVAVTLAANLGVLTFYDGASVAFGTASGSQLIARPRIAKFVSTSIAGAIVFHY